MGAGIHVFYLYQYTRYTAVPTQQTFFVRRVRMYVRAKPDGKNSTFYVFHILTFIRSSCSLFSSLRLCPCLSVATLRFAGRCSSDDNFSVNGGGTCDYPCAGDDAYICGGYLSFTVYEVGESAVSPCEGQLQDYD